MEMKHRREREREKDIQQVKDRSMSIIVCVYVKQKMIQQEYWNEKERVRA